MVGGGILARRQGTATSDGRFVLCPCGHQVHIYSALTGERVGSLVGHTGEVTCVLQDPENEGQVYTTSQDATIRLWDYRAQDCLTTINVREPVKYMVIQKDLGVAYLSIQLKDSSGRVLLYNMRSGKFSGTAMKVRSAGALALSPSGTFCAAIDRHSLFVWRTGLDVYQPLNLHHTKPYTCLAIAPDDSAIAAGDASGRILLWRGFQHHVPLARREGDHSGKHHIGSGGGAAPSSLGPPAASGEAPASTAAPGSSHAVLPAPPLTTIHWHAHAVGALCFSADGVLLLSGGAEGTLVLWALESPSRPASFLPRLGAAIVGLTPSGYDAARYLVRQADNCVRIVNTATMKVDTSVHGLRPLPAALPPYAAVPATALLPASAGAALRGSAGGGCLVVPCENAQLQFWDVLRDRHIMLLAVAPRNDVSATDGQPSSASSRGGQPGHRAHAQQVAATAPPHVSHVAFSADGSIMATVDQRSDAGPYGTREACLKFWDATNSTSASGGGGHHQPFLLNTRADEPHAGGIAGLAYHPARDMAVTTGAADGEFKVWVREAAAASPSSANSSVSQPASHWRCRSLGAYRGLPLGPAAFASDGSILAVAAGGRVTLWDPEANALATVLPPPPVGAAGGAARSGGAAPAAPLSALAFVPGTPFLAAVVAGSGLVVYNLLTAAVHWWQPLQVTSFSVDASYGLLAVAVPGASVPQPVQPPGAPQQPQPQPQHCHILVFDPASPAPRFHCRVRDAQHVQLLHLPAAGAAQAASAAEANGCSPLLVLRDSRLYSLAGQTDFMALPTPLDEAAMALLQQGVAEQQQPYGFEAAFGPMGKSQQHAGAAAMEVDGGHAGTDGQASQPKWRSLFDAPSHVLPTPTVLANAFLSLIMTADGPAAY